MKRAARVIAAVLVGSVVTGVESARAEQQFMYRFQEEGGSSARVLDMTFSPDGSRLAVATSNGRITIVNTSDGEVVDEIKSSAFALGYSRDGTHLLLITPDRRTLHDQRRRSHVEVVAGLPEGHIGLGIERKRGRLLVNNVVSGSPIAELKTIGVGDEVVGVGPGKNEPIERVIGASVDRVMKLLEGPAGSYVTLEFIPKGKLDSQVQLVKRAPVRKKAGELRFLAMSEPELGENLVWCMMGDFHTFSSAKTGEILSWIKTDSIENAGAYAVSPDSRKFAVIARTKENRDALGIEVFDLAKREREAYFGFGKDSYYDLAFSNDGSKLVVGTRNTIEFVSLADGKIVRSLSLIGDYESIADNRGPRPGPSGSLLAAGVIAARDAFVDSGFASPESKRRVRRIAVVGSALVAVGTPMGNVELWEIQSKRFVREFGREDGKPVELVRFSRDNKFMAYFVDGVLYLVDLSDGVAPSR